MIDDLHPDDELASAYLDGEATPEERPGRRRARPAGARGPVAGAAAAVARPVALDEAAIDTAVRAALAARPAAASAARRDAEIVPLASRRRRRWLGAVAAAAAVVVAVPLVASRLGQSTDEVASTAASSADLDESTAGAVSEAAPGEALDDAASRGFQAEEDVAGGADSEAPSPASPEASTTAVPTTTVRVADGATTLDDLGTIDDADELATVAAAAVDRRGSTNATADVGALPDELATCAGRRQSIEADLGPLTLVGSATYAGQPVDVLVFEPAAGEGSRGRQALAVDGSCAVVARAALPASP